MIISNIKSKLSSSDTRELVIGSGLAFIVKVFSAAGAFFLNLLVARHLGAEESGYFFLSMTIVLLLSVIGRLGTDNAIVRFVATFMADKDNEQIARFYGLLIRIIVPVLFLSSFTVFYFSDFVSDFIFNKPKLSQVLMIMGLSVIPLSLSQLNGFFLQGAKHVVPAMLFSSGAMAITVLLSVLLVEPNSAVEVAKLYLLSSVIVFVISTLTWRSKVTKVISFRPISFSSQLTSAMKSLFIIMLMAQVTQWAGELMLGLWADSKDVALFATAVRTAMLTSFILISVNAIAAPKFAAAYKNNDFESIEKTAINSSKLMTLMALPLIIFMLVFSEWIMGLFGDEFVEAANILRLLALGQFVNVITGSVGYLLQMTGYEAILKRNVIIASMIVLIGGPLLIPTFGIFGAAIVTSLSVATQNLMSYYQVKKLLGINTFKIY
ncbi:polysaccharide biosynthesis C-terminal domain-containing protein [Photobacterium satsumensis]|uniref:oligosaccharide flippase family protein n=1 Tax=Photobacterium satsumensis TaxID=2910239 RepID=UPI003D0DF316